MSLIVEISLNPVNKTYLSRLKNETVDLDQTSYKLKRINHLTTAILENVQSYTKF